jgi:hypothetical protein
MKLRRTNPWFAIACLAISMTLNLTAMGQNEASARQESGKPNDKKASIIAGQPFLWEEPSDIEQRDLFYGRGGREGAPDPAGKYRFIRRSTTGTQKKIIVTDDRGREWTVKFGPEAKPETTAARIVWAAGYHVDQNYFVEQARIEGYEEPIVRNVRFERRDDGSKEAGNWSWETNPFVGTREFEGLKVLVALLKNWDVKTSNNKIVLQEQPGGPIRRIYFVGDLGATLGATGSFFNKVPFLSDLPPDPTPGLTTKRGKGNPEAFSKEAFIKEVRDGEVIFNHERKRGEKVVKGVTVENARWMGNLLGRLSDKQLADAFRAGGFNDSETAIYVSTMRDRIGQLQKLNE